MLLLTAGHVLLGDETAQNDPVCDAKAGTVIGRVQSWSQFDGDTTVDAALVWMDPGLADPTIMGIGALGASVNLNPQEGDRLRIFGPNNSSPRETKIAVGGIGANTITLKIMTPVGAVPQNYKNQIICQPAVAVAGDSGAIAVDDQNRVVGMVVGGLDPSNPTPGAYTAITPIQAILECKDWRDDVGNPVTLSILTSIPDRPSSPKASLPVDSTTPAPSTTPSVPQTLVAARGSFGADTVTAANAASLKDIEAGLGQAPQFWGRYFYAQDQKNSAGIRDSGMYGVAENAFLASRNIPVVPLARQTTRVAKGATEAAFDAEKNVAALFQAFGIDHLKSLGGEFLFFLDSENDPSKGSPPVSAEYYEIWSKTLVNTSDVESNGAVKLLPGLYCSRGDVEAWIALEKAVKMGAPCAGLWVASWGPTASPTQPPPLDWNDSRVTPLHVTLPAPIVLWQYSSVKGYDASQINPLYMSTFYSKFPTPPN